MSQIKLDNLVKKQLADTCVGKALSNELIRQNNDIELIASENYPSAKVRLAMASIATAKYAEGYPKKRYYGGCKYIDKIEQTAIDNACKLFNCNFANVQPHSGSQANAAAYRALEAYLIDQKLLVEGKMSILSLGMNDGGHLTQGSSVNFSSHLYDFHYYSLDDNGHIDYASIERMLITYNINVLVAGYSAYPYEIDFKSLGALCDEYGIVFMVDMSHIAGLVATGEHQSPFPYADIVTSTTHKTLRGPRGGLILTNNERLAKYINSAVFPYTQGGPLENVIAAKAICFEEASQPSFKAYAKQVKENTSIFSNELIKNGIKCSQSENHLTIIDVKSSFGITGLQAQKKLEKYGIIVNKNLIHNDTEKPSNCSGIRVGFAALTTRGCTSEMARKLAHVFIYLLGNKTSQKSRQVIMKYIKDIRGSLIPISQL